MKKNEKSVNFTKQFISTKNFTSVMLNFSK